MEGQDVATIDIPGAFMQAEIDEIAHMKIEGTMAELLTKLDPTIPQKQKWYVDNVCAVQEGPLWYPQGCPA
eukprot:1136259-Ditylum_brightwellii.AAC.1